MLAHLRIMSWRTESPKRTEWVAVMAAPSPRLHGARTFPHPLPPRPPLPISTASATAPRHNHPSSAVARPKPPPCNADTPVRIPYRSKISSTLTAAPRPPSWEAPSDLNAASLPRRRGARESAESVGSSVLLEETPFGFDDAASSLG